MHCCCNITGLDVVVVSQPKTGIHAAISLVLIECNCSDCELILVLSISYTIFLLQN